MMNRFAKLAAVGFFAMLGSAAVEAQPAGNTQPGAKGTTTPQGKTGPQSGYHGGVGQTPWFANQDVRQQFKLTDQQFNQMNKSYTDAYGQYQKGMSGLGTDLTPAQRAQQTRDLQQGFNTSFSKSTNDVFTDPQQRTRYNQLYMQYQGYDAFNNPMIQEKLNLTAEQRQTLGQNGQKWHSQMNDLGRNYQTDSEGTTKKFNDMRKQYGEQLNTVLTPEQQKSWQQMIGEPYNFQASTYFQGNSGSGTGKQETPNPK